MEPLRWLMTVYNWIETLCDTPNTISKPSNYALEPVTTLITTIHQKPIAIYAQNPNVDKGFMNAESAKKICQLLDKAYKLNIPVVAILSSAGISFEDQLASGQAYTEVIRRHIELKRKIPQIALLMGPVLGAPAYSAVLMDMIIFSQYRSYLMVTSPGVVQQSIGEKTTMAELGSANMHSKMTGLADFVCKKPENQLQLTRTIINYIHRRVAPLAPRSPLPVIPSKTHTPFDMHTLIEALVDASVYHEYKTNYGQSIICTFARLHGRAVGIIANQSIKQSGAINSNASQKAAQFIRLCDKYKLPILTLIDVPGFMPGRFEEQNGLLKHGADFCCAMQTQVLRMSLVVRRCYGAAAFLLMQSKAQKGQVSLALESAQLGVMGQQSVDIFQSSKAQKTASIDYAHELGIFDEVIKLHEAREKLIYYLNQYS